MQKKLASVVHAVDERLNRVFENAFTGESRDLFEPAPALTINDELKGLTLRGGKRLRPALMVAGYELFCGSDRDNAPKNALNDDALLDAACAMELLQSYFLIHDDIMDGDPVRRGGPSVHASLQKQTGSSQMGIHLGILAGDLASAIHEWLLAGLDCDDGRKQRVQRIFSRMHMDVVFGQTLDLQGDASPEEIVLRKTASYTAIGPVCSGAVLGGASSADVQKVAALARPLGIAFQYRDDLIGMFGDEKVAGKPVGSDLRNGKRTLLVVDALNHLGVEDRETLQNMFGHAQTDEDAFHQAMTLVGKSGAKERCEKHIDSLCREVETALQQIAVNESGKSFLLWLTRLMAYREM